MNRELIVNATQKGVSIALLENKELVELYNEESGKQFTVGDIYLGRVTKLVAGLNAAFVDVGYEKDAFLHYTDLGRIDFGGVSAKNKVYSLDGIARDERG